MTSYSNSLLLRFDACLLCLLNTVLLWVLESHENSAVTFRYSHPNRRKEHTANCRRALGNGKHLRPWLYHISGQISRIHLSCPPHLLAHIQCASTPAFGQFKPRSEETRSVLGHPYHQGTVNWAAVLCAGSLYGKYRTIACWCVCTRYRTPTGCTIDVPIL